MSREPRRFGPYRVVRELGRGGMGEVFEVVHQATGAHYALKTLANRGALGRVDEATAARFRAEAELLARLDHPRIVRIHAADLEAGAPYLVQDLALGGSLQRRLEREGPLPPGEAAALVAELADALSHAHARGVLHRDLKPHNVLLDEAGTPRLTDFGLALQLDARSRLTHTGELLGSPGYMAPEQVRAEKRTDERTDVYGLAALLCGLLTGEPPFHTRGLAGLAAIVNDPPTPPSARRPAVPAWLDALALRALAKDPAARPQSAAAVADALRAGLAATPSRRVGRRVAAAIAVALLGALLLLGARWAEERARAAELTAACLAALTASEPLGAREPRLAELAARAAELPGWLPEAAALRARASALRALARAAQGAPGALREARAALAASADPDDPLALALAGGVAVLDSGVAPQAALLAVERAAARGLAAPELRGWRAHLRARAGLDEGAARATLADLDALRAALGREGARERALRVDALLALGEAAAAFELAGATPELPRGSAWRAALAESARLFAAEPLRAPEPFDALGLAGPAPSSPELARWIEAASAAARRALRERPEGAFVAWIAPLPRLLELRAVVEALARARPRVDSLGEAWRELVRFYTDVASATLAQQRGAEVAVAYFHAAACLGQVASDDVALLANLILLAELGHAKDQFLPLARHAAAAAATPDDRLAFRIAGCSMLARIHGRAAEAIALADELLEALERRGGPLRDGTFAARLFGHRDPRLWVLDARASAHWALGDSARAALDCDRARALLTPPDDVWFRFLVAGVERRLELERFEEAIALIEEAYATSPSRDYGRVDQFALLGPLWSLGPGGMTPLTAGHPLFTAENVRAELREGLRQRSNSRPAWWVRLAILELDAGEPGEAARALAHAEAMLRSRGAPENVELAAFLGQLARAVRDGVPVAREALQSALREAERQTARRREG